MNVLKGNCGDAVCITTRGTSPGANLQEIPDDADALTAELKREIMQLTEDECAQLLKAAKAIMSMTEEEVAAELERIRARRAEKVCTF